MPNTRTPPREHLRDRHRKAVAAPDHQRHIVEHEGETERQQHLAQVVAAHEAQQPLIEHEADRRDRRSSRPRPPRTKLPVLVATVKPI